VANCVDMMESSCHIFNFDCGFSHASYILLDAKFNGKVNDCFELMEATTVKLWIILKRYMYVMGLHVSLPSG